MIHMTYPVSDQFDFVTGTDEFYYYGFKNLEYF